MGQYGWNSKIGDLLKDERCVAVFKEILPAESTPVTMAWMSCPG